MGERVMDNPSVVSRRCAVTLVGAAAGARAAGATEHAPQDRVAEVRPTRSY